MNKYQKRKLEIYEEQLKINKELLSISKESLELNKILLDNRKTIEYVPVYPYQPSTTQSNITYWNNKSSRQ